MDFLLLPELLLVSSQVATSQPVYFATSTPGTLNGDGTTNLGPLVVAIAHTPLDPATNEAIVVTARAIATFDPVSSLLLTYRVMFSNEVTLAMDDAGTNGDALAGDGIFSATIAAGLARRGQMIRYFVTATDAAEKPTRAPAHLSPRSAEYFGCVARDAMLAACRT